MMSKGKLKSKSKREKETEKMPRTTRGPELQPEDFKGGVKTMSYTHRASELIVDNSL